LADKTFSFYFSADERMSVADWLWTLAFSLIMVSGILGNSIVLWIVLGKKGRCYRKATLRSENT
jgi:hypothetical protein